LLSGMSVIALACLAVAQSGWIGDWIGRHGRVMGADEKEAGAGAEETVGALGEAKVV
jgi:hypothetical protein